MDDDKTTQAAALPKTTTKKTKNADDEMNDEAALLASVVPHVQVQEQNSYESSVLQQARHEGAPVLTGIGFPPLFHDDDEEQDATTSSLLSSLALLGPGFQQQQKSTKKQKQRQHKKYDPTVDLPHVRNVLSRIRRKQQQSSSSSSQQQDLLHLKEQMLLSFLHKVAHVPPADLPGCKEEIKAEQERMQALEQPSLITTAETAETRKRKAAAPSDKGQQESITTTRHKGRIPMMKRKRIQIQQQHTQVSKQDRQEQVKQKQELKRLRQQRNRLRQERRKRLQQHLGGTNDNVQNGDHGDSSILKEDEDQQQATEMNVSNEENEEKKEGDGVNSSLSTTREIETTTTTPVQQQQGEKVVAAADDDDETQAEKGEADALLQQEQQLQKSSEGVSDATNDCDSDKKCKDEEAAAVVACPLCGESVSVHDPSQTDAILSRHMNDCQHKRQQRRSTRSSSTTSVVTTSTAVVSQRQTRSSTRGATTTTTTAATSSNTTVILDDDHDDDFDEPTSDKDDDDDYLEGTSRTAQKSNSKEETKKSATSNNSKKKSTIKPAPPNLQTKAPPLDDLDPNDYDDRVDAWIQHGIANMKTMQERDQTEIPPGDEEYDGGLWIPAWINNRLFGYQREGLQWMWKLHQQQAGGIMGDEMGLGKTVQISSYLGVLAASRKMRSALVVVPATMLQHWLKELAVWAPGLRRVLIHPSGEGDGKSRAISTNLLRSLDKWLRNARMDRVNEMIDEDDWDTMEHHSFCGTGLAIVTTYENIRRNPDIYTSYKWSYIVLDEAQKIRNPDADVTLACKRIRTPHRIAMSGTPIQNSLAELWSIFDFSNPGLLGTLPAFEQQFADPIRRGGYSNATPMQVQLAYRCALILRDMIQPYLMRRQKKDVKEVSRMPGKTEHVLFCRLSPRQRSMYQAFLESDHVKRIIRHSGTQLFAAVTMLRKICNHPDLVCEPDRASYESFLKTGGGSDDKGGAMNKKNKNDDGVDDIIMDDDDDEDVDDLSFDENDEDESLTERAGKLEVLSKILPLWHKHGHRVLIFCQWVKMLNIIQKFTMAQGWKFGRLDGKTNVGARQRLVDEFNNDKSYFGLLSTTQTGGVGLNLTSADRVILYDPAWNPQTDAQARERSWRFGQEKEVTIYRLITAGTVEEKIYQRQIFKTALSNKILQDPRQRRLFSQRDLRDLFSLGSDGGSVISGGDGSTDTAKVTRGVGVVDPENDATDELKKVMKSKGLAGVFDHHYVESDPTRKSTTVREMEEHAKRVAREAAHALQESVSSSSAAPYYNPTWTGSKQTSAVVVPNRFGSGNASRGAHGGRPSTGSLLASLKQRNADVAMSSGVGGSDGLLTDDASKYAPLLARIRDFIGQRQRRQQAPTTDEILKEFESANDECDAAIFRSLLKSVARIENGKWVLKTN